MLIQFSVTNILSFRDETVLSLSTNKDNSHSENLLSFKNERILPSVAIYGANAAGKSNLHKALTAAIIMIRNSNNLQVDQPLMVTPFLLDSKSRFDKTKFDFIYTYNDVKYEYGFVLDSNQVWEEYLYEYKSSKPSLIFERSEINKYKFTTKTKSQLSQIVDKNTSNKLFLATATSWNSDLTRDAYMWFATMIDTYDSQNLEDLMYTEFDRHQNNNDSSLNTFMLHLLQKADINISNFNYESIKREVNQLPFELPPELQGLMNPIPSAKKVLEQRRIVTSHQVVENGEKKEYLLNYFDESNGTKRLFTYGPVLKNALENGRTIIIDEIDNALHPAMTKSLIEMFQNPNINKNNAQLIFNTHEISLLDLNLFRRDQIYFVEKNNKTGVSDLYSLDEFSPRKSENIQKGYLQGRYGAMPFVNLEDIEW